MFTVSLWEDFKEKIYISVWVDFNYGFRNTFFESDYNLHFSMSRF